MTKDQKSLLAFCAIILEEQFSKVAHEIDEGSYKEVNNQLINLKESYPLTSVRGYSKIRSQVNRLIKYNSVREVCSILAAINAEFVLGIENLIKLVNCSIDPLEYVCPKTTSQLKFTIIGKF